MGVFKVDETHIFIRRDKRGRILRGESYWSIGVFERRTKKIRLYLTRERNSQILYDSIKNTIPIGLTIITDSWRVYNGIDVHGYIHKIVNHLLHYVDPNDSEIHTNNIERLWRHLKENAPKSLNLAKMCDFIQKYENIKNQCQRTHIDKLNNLLEALKYARINFLNRNTSILFIFLAPQK